MRLSPLLLALALAACSDQTMLPTEDVGDGPQLAPGTCGISVTQTADTITASANSSGNVGGSWLLGRANAVGVTLVSEIRFNGGAVTSTSSSGWVSFPYALPASPQTIDADMMFATGSAGPGDISMRVRYICADGGDTLTRKLGTIQVDVQ